MVFLKHGMLVEETREKFELLFSCSHSRLTILEWCCAGYEIQQEMERLASEIQCDYSGVQYEYSAQWNTEIITVQTIKQYK